MTQSYIQAREQVELLRQKGQDFSAPAFKSQLSAGNNNVRLARICAVWDYVCQIMSTNKFKSDGVTPKQWGDSLTDIVTSYQASLNAKYHDDFVKIAVAQREEEKKSKSLLDNL